MGTLIGAGAAGVTVLAVMRGDQVLLSADAAFSLGGADQLLVLGTDEQIEALEQAISQELPARI